MRVTAIWGDLIRSIERKVEQRLLPALPKVKYWFKLPEICVDKFCFSHADCQLGSDS
jgi:hypothetical protein